MKRRAPFEERLQRAVLDDVRLGKVSRYYLVHAGNARSGASIDEICSAFPSNRDRSFGGSFGAPLDFVESADSRKP